MLSAEHYLDSTTQLPLDAGMLSAHRVIVGGLRPLPRRVVLCFVVVLDDGAAPLGGGFDPLGAHRTRTALGDREGKAPAVPPLGALPGAGGGTARTAHFIPRVVEDEGGRLEQLRRGGDPVKRRDIDGELRPARVLTQFREHVPAIANAVDRETGDIVAVGLRFARDHVGGVGSLY